MMEQGNYEDGSAGSEFSRSGKLVGRLMMVNVFGWQARLDSNGKKGEL